MRDALIEAMARAILETTEGSWDSADTRWQREAIKDAKAALDAALSLLETPSDEMVETGSREGAWHELPSAFGETPQCAIDVWVAMLNTLKAPA